MRGLFLPLDQTIREPFQTKSFIPPWSDRRLEIMDPGIPSPKMGIHIKSTIVLTEVSSRR